MIQTCTVKKFNEQGFYIQQKSRLIKKENEKHISYYWSHTAIKPTKRFMTQCKLKSHSDQTGLIRVLTASIEKT